MPDPEDALPRSETGWFKEAVRQRAEELELKYATKETITGEDAVVIALAHPEKFDILVKMKA